MPRKKWINKNAPTTQTYTLLYRSQDDPLLNDDAAGDRALFPVGRKGEASTTPNKALHLADLENDLDFDSMRDNEGEAAEHGIYFDDTKYDYMQHLKDLGEGGGDSHFVDAVPTRVKGKGKGQMRLEDALREVNLEDELSTFSRTTKQRNLESQQDVPDEIAGFQPDMDPRLREVLEALDDDAYVDDKDNDDVFGTLGVDGQDNGELDLSEFEARWADQDDEGWESDVTEKAPEQPMISLEGEAAAAAAAAAAADDGDWLRDFAKYKRDTAAQTAPRASGSIIAASAVQDPAPTLYTLNGTPLRQKKRKGAQTNPSAYSMTSSSLARTDGQQLLDARFDQVEKMYALNEDEDDFDDMDDGGASLVSGMSKMSSVSTKSFADPGAVRADLNGMVDDFLGSWNSAHPGGGKRKGAKGKRGKNGNEVFGLQQLDEVRRELGPARVRSRPQQA